VDGSAVASLGYNKCSSLAALVKRPSALLFVEVSTPLFQIRSPLQPSCRSVSAVPTSIIVALVLSVAVARGLKSQISLPTGQPAGTKKSAKQSQPRTIAAGL